MAQEIINNGASAGDPTAENIYTSFGKSKNNFSELYNFIPTLLAKAGGVMTGILQFATGTAAAPSARIGSDQKGFYEVGSDKLGVTVAGAKVGEFNSNGYAGLTNRLILQDRKPNNTAGGTSAIGDNDRNINTVLVNNITGASLGTNVFTLPVGRYRVNLITSPSVRSGYTKIKLYNVTSSQTQVDINTNAIIGTNEYTAQTQDILVRSSISGYYFDVITSSKTFKIIHYTQDGFASDGLGYATNNGDEEIYTTIDIEKVG